MTSQAHDDRALLARAAALAGSVAGRTAPNPGVGCVLARDGVVLGEGATRPAGGPHAEVVALGAAGANARGATAYVTLEPCAHHGRTPPCVDALLAAGVARVVFVREDHNPVASGGRSALASAGVGVVGPLPRGDLLRDAVDAQLEGFLSVIERGRPFVTLKLAQTVDGRLDVPPPGRFVTGPAARRAVHRWRASVDAVLVGSGTVVADDPRLDVRHVPGGADPRPIVLDARLRTPPEARVVARGALVVTAPDAAVERRKELLDAGADVVEVPAASPVGVDLVAALEVLAAHGHAAVLAEPGATLARALIAADLVDRLVLHVALAHGQGPPRSAVDTTGQRWVIERSGGAGPDLIVHRRRERHAGVTAGLGGEGR